MAGYIKKKQLEHTELEPGDIENFLDIFRDADDLEYVSEISRRTHLYEMLPEFQLRLFEIMNNEDYSRQKREL